MSTSPELIATSPGKIASDEEYFPYGWRTLRIPLPDGQEMHKRIPLTPQDFLNPQEGDVMVQGTAHDDETDNLSGMLKRRYAASPGVAVFHDLIISWGIPALPNPAPDIAVVRGVKEKDKKRSSFEVAEEGVKPCLIIEVVSPNYRREDRVDKLAIYEQAGVEEYIIIDPWQRGEEVTFEIRGYRLVAGRYQEMIPHEAGRILSESTGLWFSVDEGRSRTILEDAESGERLLTNLELDAARRAAEARAQAAEAEVARLRAKLAHREKDE